MPEEEKKSPGQISVDLDTSGPEVDVSLEETKEEAVIDTAPETTEQETVTEVVKETQKTEDDAPLEDYSKKVQSRIAKLTGKLREAQRRENAAVEYAGAIEQKRKLDQERFQKVDSDYTAKFEESVKTGMESAEKEGYDPKSNEYYTEIDKRIRVDFGHKFGNTDKQATNRAVQSVASANRSSKPGRKTVRLTSSQVAIAKKLGVPLEEYAKQLKLTEGA